MIVACLFAFSTILFTSYTRLQQNPENQHTQFQARLNARNLEASEQLLRLISSPTTKNYADFKTFSNQLPAFYNLFVLRNGKLIYWSDNSVPIDFEHNDSLNNHRIVKTGNGYYQVNTGTDGTNVYYLTDLVKFSYKYQNDYLSSVFNPAYSLGQGYDIASGPTPYPIIEPDGKVLFYLNPGVNTMLTEPALLILFLLYIATFILLITGIFRLYCHYTHIRKNLYIFLLFALDVIILRGLLFYFRIPEALYAADLFSPLYFASSKYLPSLGDFFLNATATVLVLYFFYKTFSDSIRVHRSTVLIDRALSAFSITISVLAFYVCCYLIDTLMVNSSFSLDPGNIMDFSMYSISGFLIIAMLLMSYFLFAYPLLRLSFSGNTTLVPVLLFSGINAVLYYGAGLTGLFHPNPVNILFLVLFLITVILIHKKVLRFPHFTTLTLFVLILTAVSAFSLHTQKVKKERDERKLMAIRLSSDRDKMAEFMFADVEQSIQSDTLVKRLFLSAWNNPADEIHCIEYIKNTYFKGYWTKYSVQVTLCYPDKVLQIRPSNYLTGCREYFHGIIHTLGEKTASPHLWFIRESYDASSYIADIPYGNIAGKQTSASIVIELNRKYAPKGLGYPELLLDRSISTFNDMLNYSYAIYFKDELVKNVGEYTYSTNEHEDIASPADFFFYDKNGYNHLFHNINHETSIIISSKTENQLDKLAPFTYQFIFHIILLLIFSGILSFRGLKNKRNLDLKTRLQLMLVALILFSSLSVGISTIYNIKNLNTRKNRDMLSEKTHSVLIEMEHKLASFDILDLSQKEYLEELLTKFSLVFFSDINLYDIEGRLLASSRSQVFEEGLKSDRMNPEAYRQLALNKRTFYIMNEQIGNYNYLSAYIPFRNDQNKLTAYINLPYFAREQELRQEISSFLVAFVNIFVILTALAVSISLLVGNYLTRPLQLIRNRFTSLNLERANEKIAYSRQDELGDLVNEYNLMVDKLADSAEKLARSERESAWREMARQVAHEIKNPLTPMKLSIQHLRKAYKENAPDWENRLEKTTQTLVSQIDSLASIATAFSDFAKLPAPHNEKTELTGIIRSTLSLFSQHPDIRFTLTHTEKECFVFADEKQLSRVFINLFNNAVQAIPGDRKGEVLIKLETSENIHRIEISDNGNGIGEAEKPKIFSPNFTTKSGGMGLGLAMVKNIIDSAGGGISFVSDKSTGTTFTILLPEYQEQANT